MVYTMAKTVDQDRATLDELEVLRRIMKVQYESENGLILYNPAYREKIYLVLK